MERSVEVLAIILFGILGLSHILQPKAWVEFFILLRGKREAGAFVDGFLNLPLGAVIVRVSQRLVGDTAGAHAGGLGPPHQGPHSLLRTETGVEDDREGLT